MSATLKKIKVLLTPHISVRRASELKTEWTLEQPEKEICMNQVVCIASVTLASDPNDHCIEQFKTMPVTHATTCLNCCLGLDQQHFETICKPALNARHCHSVSGKTLWLSHQVKAHIFLLLTMLFQNKNILTNIQIIKQGNLFESWSNRQKIVFNCIVYCWQYSYE